MDKIAELIEIGYECDYLDFKEKQYHKEKSMELLMDIMATAFVVSFMLHVAELKRA